MKKYASLILLCVSLLHVSAKAQHTDPADQPAEQALKIEYFGGFTGFDAGGYQLMRSAVGQLIADGTLGTFLTVAVGKSGGGGFCVQMSPYADQTIDDVIAILASIRPADNVTVYKLTKLVSCVPETNNKNNHNKEIPQ